MKRRIKWLIAIVLILVLGLAVLRTLHARKLARLSAAAPAASAALELARSDVVTARTLDLTRTLNLSGGLKAVNTAVVKAKIAAELKTLTVREGDTIGFGNDDCQVIETPGHTAGHVSYYLPQSGVVFAADTLFALGCGRLLECPPPVMYESLKKLSDLPPDTAVYCGHEYTLANARFALTIDPGNKVLQERAKKVEALRADGKPTLPTTIGEELATNPFLRWADPAIRKGLGMEQASSDEVFAEIRRRKDNF